ncbi:MAG: SRPBCC family protein [SAR324 cluster bacterium]|nr:SRPBCC family protein [SAR324 cluster bacterium]
MKIEETFNVLKPPEIVWRFITNPERVGPCVPGLSDIEVLGKDIYKAKIKVAIGPIKASFNFEVEIIEETPSTQIVSVLRGEEGSRASLITANNMLRLSPTESGTEVYYRSEVSVTGRLGKFGLGLMKKKAKTLGEQFAKNFCQSINDQTIKE